jgi:hypothetical protein
MQEGAVSMSARQIPTAESPGDANAEMRRSAGGRS